MAGSDFGSISKEFPLPQIEATLRLAKGNMPYGSYRAAAELETNAELAAITQKRFLLVRDKIIVRDRFLSLVQSEGLGSDKLRKIMFGVWALRDERVGRFFIEVVADPTGKWRTARLKDKARYKFFAQFMAESTATKARSNIENFLKEAGIFDEQTSSISLNLDDQWLTEAVLILAEHETDDRRRQEMQVAPMQYLIDRGLNGIADATVEELRGFYSSKIEVDTSLGKEMISNNGEIQIAADKIWKRSPPKYLPRAAQPVLPDPVSQERASLAHYNLESLLVGLVERAGYKPWFNTSIDLYFNTDLGWVLAEVKSCDDLNYHGQVRRGVSQLLEYAYRSRAAILNPAKLLVMESRPPPRLAWLPGYLAALSIFPVWPSETGTRLISNTTFPARLVGIVEGEA